MKKILFIVSLFLFLNDLSLVHAGEVKLLETEKNDNYLIDNSEYKAVEDILEGKEVTPKVSTWAVTTSSVKEEVKEEVKEKNGTPVYKEVWVSFKLFSKNGKVIYTTGESIPASTQEAVVKSVNYISTEDNRLYLKVDLTRATAINDKINSFLKALKSKNLTKDTKNALNNGLNDLLMLQEEETYTKVKLVVNLKNGNYMIYEVVRDWAATINFVLPKDLSSVKNLKVNGNVFWVSDLLK